MKKIKVIFKGETTEADNNYEYTSTSCLKEGETYEIRTVGSLPGYSTCTLKGIKGTFNPHWFEKVEESETQSDNAKNKATEVPVNTGVCKTYVAISNEMPEVGKRLVLKRGHEGNAFATVRTSAIQTIEHLEDNIYVCKTKNTTYIVQVF